MKVRKRAEYEKHRERYIRRATERYRSRTDEKREYDREYRRKNAEKLIALKAVWRAENAEKVRQIKAGYKKRHPHVGAADAMMRNARKRQATPTWLTEEHIRQIKEIYKAAAERRGGPWQVDHIVPLAGKTVCGLHVPWNLRVILASENQAKGNRLIAGEVARYTVAAAMLEDALAA
jgi:5-methylcytosine-specific restriction endonuclease McrA